MVKLRFPIRQLRPGWWLLAVWVGIGLSLEAQPVGVAEVWKAEFPAAGGGRPAESAVVPVGEGGLMVAVVVAGAEGARPAVFKGKAAVGVRSLGWDPVSRLAFFEIHGDPGPHGPEWLDEVGERANAELTVLAPGIGRSCRARGWVKQVRGKVLPLALLRVVFEGEAPRPGTALADARGKVVAVFFQTDGTRDGGYAIPAEAVARVRDDVERQGKLLRGWMGVSLKPETRVPRVVRVLHGSPAARAGIQPDDVLLEIGSRTVREYADAANAFFYLMPGAPVKVRLSRGVERLELEVVPVAEVQ